MGGYAGKTRRHTRGRHQNSEIVTVFIWLAATENFPVCSFCPSFFNQTTNERIGFGTHICLPTCGVRFQCFMSAFVEELQRRKVYRVAAAYIVAAGFLIQIASAAFPAWELPNWSLRLVIAVLLIGFPMALLLAWAYDITTHGIESTPKTPGAHRRRNLILLIVSAVIVSASAAFFLFPGAAW